MWLFILVCDMTVLYTYTGYQLNCYVKLFSGILYVDTCMAIYKTYV